MCSYSLKTLPIGLKLESGYSNKFTPGTSSARAISESITHNRARRKERQPQNGSCTVNGSRLLPLTPPL